jgi:hypothetical protein
MTFSSKCTCGSGAHPRECDTHPAAYRLHLAELNLAQYINEDDAQALRALDEFCAAVNERIKEAVHLDFEERSWKNDR